MYVKLVQRRVCVSQPGLCPFAVWLLWVESLVLAGDQGLSGFSFPCPPPVTFLCRQQIGVIAWLVWVSFYRVIAGRLCTPASASLANGLGLPLGAIGHRVPRLIAP